MIKIKTSRVIPVFVCVLGLFGATAHAQQVALLDSGVDPDAGFNITGGFNYFDNTDDTSDISDRQPEGHGTVATRVAAEGFSGEIVPYVISDGSPLSSASAKTAARDSALVDILSRPDIRVVGMSIGGNGISEIAAPTVANLSNNNRIITINAGNDGNSQPNILSTSSSNLAGVIIVGGTDTNGDLLPLTNRAGTTAESYIAAIGLPSPDAQLGGSSWAAARIAGIAGAVFLQNPDLTTSQVIEIIFDSAEDRGASGTDPEYGRGVILSASQVLNNVMGPVVVPTVPEPVNNSGGGGGSSAGAALVVAGAVAGGIYLLSRPKTELEKTLVLDSYGRPFQIDLGKQISVNDGVMHLDNFFSAMEQTSINQGAYLPDLNTEVAFSMAANTDHRYDMIEYFAMPGDVVMQGESADISIATASQLSPKLGLTTGYRVSPGQMFGASSSVDSHAIFGGSSFITGQSFGSLLSGFSEQAQTATLSYAHGKTGKFSSQLGFVSVDQSQDFGLNSFSSIFEGKYKVNSKANVKVQLGQIEERGSLFGGSAGGALGVNTSTTYAINLAGSIKASERFSVVANYGLGRTYVDSAEHSLLDEFSDLRSNWYSIGLIGNDIFRSKDQMGLAFSQPLKIRSGSVNYSIPTGQDQNYNILFNTERVDLSDTQATEHNFEAYYRTMLNDKIEFGSFLSFRDDPNHVSGLGDELLVMATLKLHR